MRRDDLQAVDRVALAVRGEGLGVGRPLRGDARAGSRRRPAPGRAPCCRDRRRASTPWRSWRRPPGPRRAVDAPHVAGELAVLDGDPLGPAGRARGVDDVGEVVRQHGRAWATVSPGRPSSSAVAHDPGGRSCAGPGSRKASRELGEDHRRQPARRAAISSSTKASRSPRETPGPGGHRRRPPWSTASRATTISARALQQETPPPPRGPPPGRAGGAPGGRPRVQLAVGDAGAPRRPGPWRPAPDGLSGEAQWNSAGTGSVGAGVVPLREHLRRARPAVSSGSSADAPLRRGDDRRQEGLEVAGQPRRGRRLEEVGRRSSACRRARRRSR